MNAWKATDKEALSAPYTESYTPPNTEVQADDLYMFPDSGVICRIVITTTLSIPLNEGGFVGGAPLELFAATYSSAVLLIGVIDK